MYKRAEARAQGHVTTTLPHIWDLVQDEQEKVARMYFWRWSQTAWKKCRQVQVGGFFVVFWQGEGGGVGVSEPVSSFNKKKKKRGS